MVYSHDTFGLGNIRILLSICRHLIDSIPDLSILIISGSPMIHSFRIPKRLDYIKLPCLSRTEREGYSVKYLGTDIGETMKLRSGLILSAVANFKPDLLLVDKKPYGVKEELGNALNYLKTHLPATKLVLLLRDILDSPEVTRKVWEKKGYYEAVRSFYDLVLTLGMPEIFDPREEYRFPAYVSEKVRFCGYIRREAGIKSGNEIRQELQLNGEKLILVTAGGGEDGYRLLEAYVAGLEWLPPGHNSSSLIICGPEMPEPQRKTLYQAAAKYPHAKTAEFTDDLISYMDAADLIISMGGFNTICEILSLNKKAVVVPRARPVEEQWIRAERMAHLGYFKAIHPDHLTPQVLIHTLLNELSSENGYFTLPPTLDFDALPKIANWILTLLFDPQRGLKPDSPLGEYSYGTPSSQRPNDLYGSFLNGQ